ncbi:MAG: antitoxin VapB family protein [Thaumarchaeota archaeon]|nr:antitoxin VapB family protein [Nitrososphaerota archaeon]
MHIKPALAHRTITISEEAHRSLAKLKKDKESFTEVILRLASARGSATHLLKYLEQMQPSEDLAESIDAATRRTRRAKLRKPILA